MSRIGSNKGFTLLELMIVVAILGIIAAIAIPSYQQYVQNARATDAQGALMSLASRLERFHTQNSTYAGATLGSAATDIFPAEAPLEGTPKFYDLVIVAASTTANSYRIEARPKNGQGGNTFVLLSTGQRIGWD
ncbi:MAG: type IV pilin protein [Marinobacter sp.]|uniref:type IV pilin protein n=1 Tax=Marinobacter sp. TaxID=50741 RepID=UPI00299F06F4|nr:type IV pilin protein [Marinobacter sp.]MDX1634639.1 type IV pilin protein [Marinobacter sp.]